MKFDRMTKWRDYSIRFEFKNIDKSIDNAQLLVFMNDELAYKSKKNSFKKRDIKTYGIKLNKWKIPHYEPIETSFLIWSNTKEHDRYINFCKRFKYSTCHFLQEGLTLKLSNYDEIINM